MGAPDYTKLAELNDNYHKETGKHFEHFYCPVLFRDEPAELCMGHIINKAFPESSRLCTVQREDVDNFYGSRFEAGFLDIQYSNFDDEEFPLEAIMTDPALSKRFNAQVYINDQPVKHIVGKSGLPPGFVPVQIGNIPAEVGFGLEVRGIDLESLRGGRCEIEARRDIRLEVLVSTIKAAHLTMFHTLGYGYALKAAGHFVGYDILGKFFLENQSKSKREVTAVAQAHFGQFVHMVRPLLQSPFENRSTLDENELFACVGASGQVWAMMVIVRTGGHMHSVMIPAAAPPDAAFTFLDFLKNDNEQINVAPARFNTIAEIFEISTSAEPMYWKKSGVNLV